MNIAPGTPSSMVPAALYIARPYGHRGFAGPIQISLRGFIRREVIDLELEEAVKRIERFFGGLESFNLLSPKIAEAWSRIETEITI